MEKEEEHVIKKKDVWKKYIYRKAFFGFTAHGKNDEGSTRGSKEQRENGLESVQCGVRGGGRERRCPRVHLVVYRL